MITNVGRAKAAAVNPGVRGETSWVGSPSMIGRIPVTQVSPVVECGRWPAKAAVGERITLGATVFREGHDAVAANGGVTPAFK